MGGPRKTDAHAKPRIGEAVTRIEAALQAGLGAGAARPDLARQALGAGPAEPDVHLEAWLEAVAAELRSSTAVLVPDDMVEAIAQRMMANPEKSIGAHGKIADGLTRNLTRRP
jgi:hypothetical protein